ncbi:MAG: DUF1080 domain-containing protein [Kiritimatiellae bacterium]|nr:DUF1080 domain-containing protein [Kiritimatiellia bacterium]
MHTFNASRSRSLAFTALIAAGMLFNLSAVAEPAPHPETTEWKNLIAADLSNVEMPEGSWEMKEGVLVAKTHDTIWSKESYANFILDLEFKVAKESNSGVFLRSGNTKNVLAALEVQVHEDEDGALYGMVGAIYNAQPPAKKMQNPVGEWNRFTITCNNSKASLIFNGEKVWDIDLDNWNEARQNPDGTKNKFGTALKDFSRNGPIGFQGLHGKAQAPVWYRNIKIKEL